MMMRSLNHTWLGWEAVTSWLGEALTEARNSLTDGPLRCLKFLIAIHADKEPQAPGLHRISRAVQAPERSVKRWLSHLATIGAIVMRHGGGGRHANISVFISIQAFLASLKEMAPLTPVFGPTDGSFGPTNGEKWPHSCDVNLKEEEVQERKSPPVENIEPQTPKTPELSEEDRQQLSALRRTHPHASKANLLEALAEYKASGVKFTDTQESPRPMQSSAVRRPGTSSPESTEALRSSIRDLVQRKKLG